MAVGVGQEGDQTTLSPVWSPSHCPVYVFHVLSYGLIL